MADMEKVINLLVQRVAQLGGRMTKLRSHIGSSFEMTDLYDRMHRAEQRIIELLPNLRALKNYMTHYKNYLQLHDTVMKAQRTLEQAQMYIPMIENLENALGVHFGDYDLDGTPNERLLTTLAEIMHTQWTTGYYYYISTLRKTVISLQEDLHVLNTGMSDPVELAQPYARIHTTAQAIELQLVKLKGLARYIEYHLNYFILYGKQKQVLDDHNRGLLPLNIPIGSAYPQFEYAIKLYDDLKSLTEVHNHARKYTQLFGKSHEIILRLTQGYTQLISSNTYAQESRLHNAACDEELRARTEYYQRQQLIAAQQRQAEETQRQRILQEQALSIEQEKLALQKLQLEEQRRMHTYLQGHH